MLFRSAIDQHVVNQADDFAATRLLSKLHKLRLATEAARDASSRVMWACDEGDPRYPQLIALRAGGYAACGNFTQAETIAMRALLIEPSTVSATYTVVQSMAATGRYREGQRFLREMGDYVPSILNAQQGSEALGDPFELFLIRLAELTAILDVEQGKHSDIVTHRLSSELLTPTETCDDNNNNLYWRVEAAQRFQSTVAVAARLHFLAPLLQDELERARGPSLLTKLLSSESTTDDDAQSIWSEALDFLDVNESTFSDDVPPPYHYSTADAQNLSVAPALIFESHVMLALAMTRQHERGKERLARLQNVLTSKCDSTQFDVFVEEAHARHTVGLELCEAFLISQSQPELAAAKLKTLRYHLPMLTSDFQTKDLINQVWVVAHLLNYCLSCLVLS